MNDDMQVTVTLTAEDLAFYDQARAAGIPAIIVSMYNSALKRLVAAEREACAKVCEDIERRKWETLINGGKIDKVGAKDCAAAIRARGEK